MRKAGLAPQRGCPAGDPALPPLLAKVQAVFLVLKYLTKERKNLRVLITGGAGFIGSHLADAYEAR